MNTDEALEPSVIKAIRSAVNKFKRRCWWLDEGDMFGWGVQIVLEAARTYRPERGEWSRYYRSSLRRGLWRRMLRESAPVSAPDHHLRELAGLTRAPLLAVADRPADARWADDVLADKRWRKRVGKLLRNVATCGVEEEHEGQMALSVLLGAEVGEVARDRGTNSAKVKAAVQALETAIRESTVFQALLRERC